MLRHKKDVSEDDVLMCVKKRFENGESIAVSDICTDLGVEKGIVYDIMKRWKRKSKLNISEIKRRISELEGIEG